MEIELSHVNDQKSYVDIHLYVSSKNNSNYFEKLFDLTEENGRYLVIHARKEKSVDGSYPYRAYVEGSIYDKTGEICIVSNRMFHKDEIDAIDRWIDEHQNQWLNAIEK